MTDEGIKRRRFLGKVTASTIGAGLGFAASFPVAEGTSSLRGTNFPKENNLDNARVEKQCHELILEFLDYERNVKNRPPRMREKDFKGFLNTEKKLNEEDYKLTVKCFETLSAKKTKEQELRKALLSQITSYDKDITTLEDEKRLHAETQDLTTGNMWISIGLSGLLGLFGWFVGAKIDANSELSDEQRAEQAMIDARK